MMKIAVSTKGKSLYSDVDPRFGRSTGFILFDTDTGNADYLDHSSQRALSQAKEIKAAQMIADTGAGVLITGQLGPKSARILKKSGIKIFECTGGTVQEAMQALGHGQLQMLVEDHIRPGPGKRGG